MSKTKRMTLEHQYRAAGFAFLAPAVIIYIIFAVYPFFDSLILSFQKWNGFSARQFVALDNYIKAFNDKTFLLAIRNSVYLGVTSSIISVVVGVLMAWLLLYVGRKWGGIFRTILFSPSMIPAVITGLVFAFVFEPDIGILNSLLHSVGLDALTKAWLTNKGTALNCILFVSAWKQVGLTMVLCFAGISVAKEKPAICVPVAFPENGAISAEAKHGPMSLVRFDGDGGVYSILLGHARGIEGPWTRGTYVWVEVNNLKRLEAKVVEGPYIHHVAAIHGDVVPVIYEACKYIGVKPDLYDPIEDKVKAYLHGEDVTFDEV